MTAGRASPAKASSLLADIFPPGVAAYELRGSADPTLLLPEEVQSCDALHPKRLSEFAGGRICARRALDELSFANFAVRRNADRTPQWPDRVVGSITHTVGFCGAVAGLRSQFGGLGVDAELIARVTPDVWPLVFTQRDVAQLVCLPPHHGDGFAAAIFSAKEAFYKCQYGVTRRWLDYADVSVDVSADDAEGGAFVIHAATDIARAVLRGVKARGRYRLVGPLVVSGVALSRDEAVALADLREGVA
jgi:4'-phosphopantetheinyl transferase EntD